MTTTTRTARPVYAEINAENLAIVLSERNAKSAKVPHYTSGAKVESAKNVGKAVALAVIGGALVTVAVLVSFKLALFGALAGVVGVKVANW